jgi:predicted HD phosphohydrolase
VADGLFGMSNIIRSACDALMKALCQCGTATALACAAFEAEPFFADAVKLRVWHDLDKRTAWFEDTRQDALDHLMQLMHRVAQANVIQI